MLRAPLYARKLLGVVQVESECPYQLLLQYAILYFW